MEKNFKEKVFNAFLDYYERANQDLIGSHSFSILDTRGRSEYIYMKIFNEFPHMCRPGY